MDTWAFIAKSSTSIRIDFKGVESTNGPVTSYYIIVETLQLTEEERVEAGIASGPKGYVNGNPVFPETRATASSDKAMAQEGDRYGRRMANYGSTLNGQHRSAFGQNGQWNQLSPATGPVPYPAGQRRRPGQGSYPTGKGRRPGHVLTPTSQGGRFDPMSPDDSQGENWDQMSLGTGQNGRFDQGPPVNNDHGTFGQLPADTSQSERWDQAPSGTSQNYGQVPPNTSQNGRGDQTHPANNQNGMFDQMPDNQNGRFDHEPNHQDGRFGQMPNNQNGRYGPMPPSNSQNGRYGPMPPSNSQNGRHGPIPPSNSQNGRLVQKPPGTRPTDMQKGMPSETSQNGRQGQFPFANAQETAVGPGTKSDHGFVDGWVDGSARAPPGNRVKNSAGHFRDSPNNPTDSSGRGQPGGDGEKKPVQNSAGESDTTANSNIKNSETGKEADREESLEQNAETAPGPDRASNKTHSKLTRMQPDESPSLQKPASDVTTEKETGSRRKSSVPFLIVRQTAKHPLYETENDMLKELDSQAAEKTKAQKPSGAYPNTDLLSSEEKQIRGKNGQTQGDADKFLLEPSLTIQKFKPQQPTKTLTPPMRTIKKVKYRLPAKGHGNAAVRRTKNKQRNSWEKSDFAADTEEVDPQVAYRLSVALSGKNGTTNVSSGKATGIASTDIDGEDELKKTIPVTELDTGITLRKTVPQKRKPTHSTTDQDKQTSTDEKATSSFPSSTETNPKDVFNTSANGTVNVATSVDNDAPEGRRNEFQQMDVTSSTRVTTPDGSMMYTSQIMSSKDVTPAIDITRGTGNNINVTLRSRGAEDKTKPEKAPVTNDIIGTSETASKPIRSGTKNTETREGHATAVTATFMFSKAQDMNAKAKGTSVQNIQESLSLTSVARGTVNVTTSLAPPRDAEGEQKDNTPGEEAGKSELNQADTSTVQPRPTEAQNQHGISVPLLRGKRGSFRKKTRQVGLKNSLHPVKGSDRISSKEKNHRRRRQSSKTNPKALPPGRIAAELDANSVSTQMASFVIGDGITYGGYTNKPLRPSSRYNIYLVANSKVETALFSASKSLRVSMPMEPTITNQNVNGRRDNYVVIGVMCSLVLWLLLIMFWLKCLQYRDRNYPLETSCCICQVPDQFFLLDNRYPKNMLPRWWGNGQAPPPQGGPLPLTPERHWTQTFSLSEPRSILTGRELLPPTKMPPPNPHPDRPVGSEPVTFQKEFQALPRPNPANSTLGGRRHPELNNTPNVLPFDATRVLLDHDGTGAGDYVNASFITGYMDDSGTRSLYIAAQCPFDEATALNTWRMIFQQAVGTVVVLNRTIEDGVLCCLQFWPEIGKQETGPFVIQTMDQFTYAHYTEVVVSVRQKKWRNKELMVRLFCFTSWPENAVPQDAIPLVELCTRVHKSQGTSDRPMLVQCDTGSGRSAVFIAMDILLAQYAAEYQTSVYEVVCALRSERPYMIQDYAQYLLVYEAVLEEMHAGNTWVSDDLRDRYRDLNSHNPNTGHTYLRDQFILLEIMLNGNRLAPGDAFNTQATSGIPLAQNAPDVIPGRRLPPVPSTLPPPPPPNTNYNSNVDHWPQDADRSDSDQDSMVGIDNVTFVDGYRQKCQFIMAKSPVPATIADFWRHVYENDVRTIVMMQDMETFFVGGSGGARGEYWPTLGSHSWDPYLVELVDTECDHNLTVRTLRLQHKHRLRDEGKVVRQFHFHGWNPQNTAPPQAGGGGGYGQWGGGGGSQQQQQYQMTQRLPSDPSQQQYQPVTEECRRSCQGCPPPAARSTLLSLHTMVKQWQSESSMDSTPILVHCKNGAQCSGLYVAMSLMIARIDEENLVSVYRICRSLRKQCPRTIGNSDQYKYLHKLLWDYINLPPTEEDLQDRGWGPPLDSPEAEYRGGRCRGVMEEGWGEGRAEDGKRVAFQGASKSGPPERDQYTSETVELTETEEEQTEGSTTRVSDYYSMSTLRTPTRRSPSAPQNNSSNFNDAYRYTPPRPRLSDRPPRQERGGGDVAATPREKPPPPPQPPPPP
ncbi:hypothetical protein ACOMHN_060327 [Nucella lapillus]